MNTRFNPTTNGRLHLGHLYLVLLNYHAAKSTGGRFIVRFDDDQQLWLDRLGPEGVAEFTESIREDLSWMGVAVDTWSSEAADREVNAAFIGNQLSHLEHGEGLGRDPDKYMGFLAPDVKGRDCPYPYVPYLTAVKVAQDYRESCDLLIRGDELVTEFSLYCYFCRLLAIPIPEFKYVPRLTCGGEDLADVSKTAGNFKIAAFREGGWTPREITVLLARSCLVDPDGEWTFENVKVTPSLEQEPAYGLV